MGGRTGLALSCAFASAIGLAGVVSREAAAAKSVVVVTELAGPAGSEAFGSQVLVLSNGNYVVTDPLYDAGGVADVGAVHLYNGVSDSLISTLTGSHANDRVGTGSLVEVGGSNVVVISTTWTGGISTRELLGAATWIDGKIGLNGTVSSANSLTPVVYSETQEGRAPFVTVLANGNYVVASKLSYFDARFTWGSGASGVAGMVSLANSQRFTSIRLQITPLTNGNYIVRDSDFDSGGLTWADGSVGGHRRSARLYGGARVSVGQAGVIPLANGDALALTPAYDSWRGAITRIDGDDGPPSHIDSTNSLVGGHGGFVDQFGDAVGDGDVVELANGNIAILNRRARLGTDAEGGGAITVLGANEPTSGKLQDRVNVRVEEVDCCVEHLVPLAGGDFVFVDAGWDDGSKVDLGLVQRLSGSALTAGVIDGPGALTGATAGDSIGSGGVVPLSDGGYVVSSPFWDHPDGTIDVGASTKGGAGVGIAGRVSTTNSLHGTLERSSVGDNGALALNAGAYVALSSLWSRSGLPANGAATYVGPGQRLVGPVSQQLVRRAARRLNWSVGRAARRRQLCDR
jgi:trimeric autotransporter adhesin